MEIIVRYSSCDGYSERRKFKTLKGAQKFAHRWIGEHPEIGSCYAVSGEGVGKITVQGCSLRELFPGKGESGEGFAKISIAHVARVFYDEETGRTERRHVRSFLSVEEAHEYVADVAENEEAYDNSLEVVDSSGKPIPFKNAVGWSGDIPF